MGQEIERKFLIESDTWPRENPVRITQGYLASTRKNTVRIRIAGEQGFLTIKGPTVGITRPEFEYEIPLEDARRMLDTLCEGPFIDKTRYSTEIEGHLFVIDEFYQENQGLVVAEVELETEESPFPRPEWLGREVTDDHRYTNASLVRRPYTTWE